MLRMPPLTTSHICVLNSNSNQPRLDSHLFTARPPLGMESDDDPLCTCLGNRIARCDGARTHPVTALSYITTLECGIHEHRRDNPDAAMGAARSRAGQSAALVSAGQLRRVWRHPL